MKKYSVIALLIALAAFTGAPVAHADETTTSASFFAGPFELLMKTLAVRKENKEANKNVRNELIESQKNNSSQILMDAADRLQGIADRIDSRIKKTELSGIDLSLEQAELTYAQNKITIAKKGAQIIASSSPEVLSNSLQAFLNTAMINLSDAKSALEQATLSLNADLGN